MNNSIKFCFSGFTAGN
ncbi:MULTISPECIES: peptide IlvX [Citrobacter]|nr:peptide IlvX [Citrobacter sedlakii]QUC32465.1 peptide IlvX [Citrobacter sedlakii]